MSILAITETAVVADDGAPRLHELVAEHGPWLRRLVRRRMADPMLVDDAVQETLLRVYRSSPPTDERELRRWLAVVARRACADVWRTQPPRAAALDEQVPASGDAIPGSDEHVAGLTHRARIDDTLVRLPARHRRLLHKQAVLGLSYEEIARQEEASITSITSALSRARAGFRRRYGDRDPIELPVWLVPLHRLADRIRSRTGALLAGRSVEWAAASVTIGMAAALVVAVPPGSAVSVPAAHAAPAADAASGATSGTAAVERGEDTARRDPVGAGLSTGAGPASTPSPTQPNVPTPAIGTIGGEPLHVDLAPDEWTVSHSVEVEAPGGAVVVQSETTFFCERSRVGTAVCPAAAQVPGAHSSR